MPSDKSGLFVSMILFDIATFFFRDRLWSHRAMSRMQMATTPPIAPDTSESQMQAN